MSVLFILLLGAVVLLLGARFYARLIARVLGERADRPTPAMLINDGRDYVPTRTPVVFAHHYASIAGAGPIIGPVLALYYGWGPAVLWILLGGVFFGAVHDYVATHIAVREGGKNLAVVARRYIGRGAFLMMLVLLVALLVLVCAAFLDLSATALTSKVGLGDLGLTTEQSPFRVVDDVYFALPPEQAAAPTPSEDELRQRLREQFALRGRALSDAAALAVVAQGTRWQLSDGQYRYLIERKDDQLVVYEQKAVIGGIASTSVVVITLFSPLLGLLYLKRKTPVWICSLLAVAICALSIWIGLRHPIDLRGLAAAAPFGWEAQQWWKFFLSAYVLISAGLPVWLFLQSRDFINVHILYVGMGCLVVALLTAALRGGGQAAGQTAIPFSNLTQATARLGPVWPVLFVTIACGAVSGFHSLCAGGTTCKQLRSETAARQVGYYAMLLESFLALCVVAAMLVGLSLANYRFYCYPAVDKGNAVLTFAMAVGHSVHSGLGLPVAVGALGGMLLLEGFLVTTLDTAIRLTRYMIEEAWATFFGRYDVFAGRAGHPTPAEAEQQRGAVELTGTGGLSIERPDLDAGQPARPLPTRGAFKLLLRLLGYYWVNSGIAVGLMLLLGWGKGYTILWRIFGSSNQLLAALTLVVATCWLVAKRRPVWYTLIPAMFMLITSLWMLLRELIWKFLPGWPDTAPLAVTAIVVIMVAVGIVVAALRRWARRPLPAAACADG